jgi:hypothetical protein
MERKVNEMCNVPDQILALLQKDVAEIKLALLGNEYNPTSGLVYRTAEAERQLERLRNRIDRMMWTVGGAAAVLTVVLNILWAWFQKVILGM